MLTIVTICARGGSVGVPGKNIRPLMGKPLIVHTIDQALQLDGVDGVFVSTDSEEIAGVARDAGAQVPFLRPATLATSGASKIDALEHLATWVDDNVGQVGTLVDLDPTSPLRHLDDIRNSIAMLDAETDVVFSGYEADKNPYFNMVEVAPDGHVALVKSLPGGVVARQQAPAVYAMNASIYIWRRASLTKGLWGGRSKLYVMPRDRSIDIDEPLDFDIVALLMRRRETS